MVRISSYLLASAIGAIATASVLASCSTSDDPLDGDGGEGADAGATTGGTGGTGGNGGTSGSSGSSGEGPGTAGQGGEAGGGGSGGAVDENFCELAGGAGGSAGGGGEGGATESADGRSCAQYCTDFFASCADNDEFPNEAECLRLCRLFGNEQLCCRAAAVLVPNCAAAAGDMTCN